jgi:transcriptional regulator with XRE-family HTH domain
MKSKFELYVIDKVKHRRQVLGISQQQLAFRMDLSIGFIGKIESPKYSSKWNLDHLNQLADVLNCSPKDFLPEHFIKV